MLKAKSFLINKIYNESCFITMQNMLKNNVKCDLVMTSPPYNNSRNIKKNKRATDNYENRYDIFFDTKTEQEYINWTIDIFNNLNLVLKPNGAILYNLSYSTENPNTLWRVLNDVLMFTDFMIADCIVWKKNSALPNNVSPNKLTRICEFLFVFCRKTEYDSFFANKNVKSVGSNGQNYFEVYYNFIEARNNDGPCDLNKATYSTELCNEALRVYARPNSIVYDPFMGTGTTACSCVKADLKYIGSELSSAQCEFAKNRIDNLEV